MYWAMFENGNGSQAYKLSVVHHSHKYTNICHKKRVNFSTFWP